VLSSWKWFNGIYGRLLGVYGILFFKPWKMQLFYINICCFATLIFEWTKNLAIGSKLIISYNICIFSWYNMTIASGWGTFKLPKKLFCKRLINYEICLRKKTQVLMCCTYWDLHDIFMEWNTCSVIRCL
jgi:hypothetical protein